MKLLRNLALATFALVLLAGVYNSTHAASKLDGPPCPINLCPPGQF
jgi:hypothetical protein